MSTSAQKGLDSLLALLDEVDETTRAKGKKKFTGSDKDNDLFSGNDSDNTAQGKGGDDILLGKGGNDKLFAGRGDDVVFGGKGKDEMHGDQGNDTMLGEAGADKIFGGSGDDFLAGGADNDLLEGGKGNDQLVGGDGIDTLKGGKGSDQFVYEGNLFANGVPALAGQTGIKVLNQPDVIKDFSIGTDQFAFNKEDLGIDELKFQKGTASQLQDGNLIVLTDPFAAAGAAAKAIANNNNITADEGIFVYFNTTLGLTRIAYSQDLGDGGDVSVLANLDNQRGQTGMDNIKNFSAKDFTLA